MVSRRKREELEGMNRKALRELEEQLQTTIRDASELLCAVRGEIMIRIREDHDRKGAEHGRA